MIICSWDTEEYTAFGPSVLSLLAPSKRLREFVVAFSLMLRGEDEHYDIVCVCVCVCVCCVDVGVSACVLCA